MTRESSRGCRDCSAPGDMRSKPYSSPQVFLDEHDVAVPGCAVLDVSMPGLDGLEIQHVLTAAGGSHRPVVFVTGKGDIPTSVRAMKAGAIDFLTKPVKEKDLIEALSRAEARDTELRRTSFRTGLDAGETKETLRRANARFLHMSWRGDSTSRLPANWVRSKRPSRFIAAG